MVVSWWIVAFLLSMSSDGKREAILLKVQISVYYAACGVYIQKYQFAETQMQVTCVK